MQVHTEVRTWGEGLCFGVWLGGSRLGPLGRDTGRGIAAGDRLVTARGFR